MIEKDAIARGWHATPWATAQHLTRDLAPEAQWKPARHLRVLSRLLQGAARGGVRLCVSMPPRHGKSLLTSVWFPVWFLSHYPSRKVVMATHSHEFSQHWGSEVRALLREHGEILCGVKLREDSQAKGWWLTEQGGGMLSVGRGSSVTGRGAHLLVIDDILDGMEEGLSPTILERCWDWYQGTARTRLEPGASIVVLMTRWNEGDLIGRLKRQQDEAERAGKPPRKPWTFVDLPAVAEEKPGPLDWREPGAPLWAERWPLEDLGEIRADVGSYVWAAEFQCRPAPAEGNILKRHYLRWWHRDEDGIFVLGDRRVRLEDLIVFMSVDLAGSKRTTADLTCAQVWGVVPKWDTPRLLLDQALLRLEAPDHLRLIAALHERWRCLQIGVESEHFGMAVVQAAKRQGVPTEDGRRRVILPIVELEADRSKLARFLPAAADAEQGRVWLPANAEWTEALVTNLTRFAGEGSVAHDDDIDAFSHARTMAEKVTHGMYDGEWAKELQAGPASDPLRSIFDPAYGDPDQDDEGALAPRLWARGT